ncbi:autotransporter outer membrane beta-barrel domain-containing protein [Achromobacter pestifer]|uniref:Autotransporter domain-containing protein n=1 Tax=Achromobacter pestifer TaxID=1353889 RepID=A0A6S7BDW2_9BURK|nr:autotransporter outer membrane beta-barrel domain-containing protein [Achromobacter pestifer]CAB3709776.1 hypothetical protein LMG3431_05924 [Achromobacter pestifer]
MKRTTRAVALSTADSGLTSGRRKGFLRSSASMLGFCAKSSLDARLTLSPLLLSLAVMSPVYAGDTVYDYTDGSRSSTAGGSEKGSNGSPNIGQSGGSPAGVTVGLTGSSTGVIITTSNAPGVLASSTGGVGSNGAPEEGDDGSGGGNGGAGGDVSVTGAGAVGLAVSGDNAIGVQASSTGGAGGFAGSEGGNAGFQGGYGGSAGNVTVDFSQGSGAITTNGASAFGVLAASIAGNTGSNGTNFITLDFGDQANGRHGGNSGVVTVTTGSAMSILTTGTNAIGIVARSVSGNGGDGTSSAGPISTGKGGTGGNGGVTQNVYVTNAGLIGTTNTGAIGIFAQSVAGSGGAGGDSQDVGGSDAGQAGNGGTPGEITVANSGTITTAGIYAPGILAQSVSGAGGIGGSAAGLFDAKGGQGGNTPDGGTITVNQSGAISTTGANSQGIVAQSLGGGGGMGGDAGGMIDIDGGTGGTGGNGGTVRIDNLGGTIRTSNQLSQGVVAQSIGGGGGMGGVATAAGAIGASAIGGNGGVAGAGGYAEITTNGLGLSAAGTASSGLIAQSIGGGGGAGGGAYSTSAGPLLDIAVAVGGTGGSGGDGGTAIVTVQNSSITTGQDGQEVTITRNGEVTTVNLPAADSHGVVVQAIGGGGGNGGAGSAASYAIAIPTGSETPGANITFSGAFSTGGSGGTGGGGGQATGTISNASSITTAGDGSIGAIVQSIGGGGGNGGDSSAMASSIGYGIPIPFVSGSITPSTNAINVSHSVGGSGGSGGNGGTTVFTLGDSGSTTSRIMTSGDGGMGALVQSIGGGGGNGGIGNAAVKSWSTSQNADFSIGVGGSGSAGGDGGSVTATINANGNIVTHGHGAEGLLAQSIGGGGGVGSGSAINVTGLNTWADAVGNIPTGSEVDEHGNKIAVGMNVNRTINVAAQNGGGGHANTVTVTHNGTIATDGGDAAGIVAQSIGGGGGSAGSAGADSSTGVLPGASGASVLTQTALVDAVTVTVPITLNSTINFGTAGANTGSAGTVNVNSTGGTITTLGDYSAGIIAQSIGSGGGRGRVVTVGAETGGALDNAAKLSVKTDITLGSKFEAVDFNPSIGHGDDVQVVLSGASISTGQPGASGSSASTPNSGLHAYGILAQSIGGGGGLGIDGSVDPNGSALLGMTVDVASGILGAVQGGTGGQVTLRVGQGETRITTHGDGAHGALLQSIGGGGGVANFGSSASTVPEGSTRRIGLELGAVSSAQQGAYGPELNGDTVQVIYDQGAALNIATSGVGAFGMLAQSIGGGGGLVGVSQGVEVEYGRIGMADGIASEATGSGGAVSVALAAGTTIITTGTGSHGIVAQSIGGGGGLVMSYQSGEVPKLIGTFDTLAPTYAQGNAAAVTVSTNGQINVAGAGAYGVLAQSLGGGGGMFTVGSNVYLGQTPAVGSEGASGAVAVTVQGSIVASGENGIGIVAQSQGPSGDGTVTVNLGAGSPGTVMGGSGEQGVGILIAGGNSSNKITIGQNSWVGASSGSAIKAVGTQGSQKVDVDNQGQIYGNTWLQGGSISGNFQNPTGTPPSAQSGTLTNSGSLMAVPGKTSYIDGHLVQTAAGRIVPHLDYSNGLSGQYVVTGSAVLDGTIEPTLASAMPNRFLPVLRTEGPTTGTLRAPDSPLFAYTVRQTGNQRDMAITGTHFNAPALGLNKHKGEVARTLENVFASGNANLGRFFAGLDATARTDVGAYQDAIGELSPRSTMTLLSRVAADASRIADASMSCPQFASGAAQENAILVEGECAYLTTRGNITSLSGDADRGSSRLKSFALQGGGQREVRPGLLLGGSLAYQADDFSGHSDGVSADGNSVQGAFTLKQNLGAWQASGALFGNYGEYDIKRRIAAPGFSVTAKGDAPMYSVGIRGRLAYTAGTAQLYLRPSVNLDLIHTGSGAFTEKGAGDLGLKVASSTYNTAVLTPEIEIGGRTDLKDGGVLRSFALAGVSIRSNDDWRGRASFVGGERSPSFGMQAPLDRVALRLGAGVQLFANERVDVQIRYDAELGSEAKSHNAMAKFAYRF